MSQERMAEGRAIVSPGQENGNLGLGFLCRWVRDDQDERESGSGLQVGDLSGPWRDIVDAIPEELRPLVPALHRYIQPTVRLIPNRRSADAVGESRIGGFADLPIDLLYPTDVDGSPLAMILQVNTRDALTGIIGAGCAVDGVLQIFVSPSDPCFGAGRPDGFKVLFHPSDGPPLARRETPRRIGSSCGPDRIVDPRVGRAVDFEPGIVCPVMSDGALARIFRSVGQDPFAEILGQRLIDTYRDTFEIPGCHLLGAANFNESPPAFWSHEWTCLLEIDGLDGVCELGDAEFLSVLIRKRDLAAMEFGNCVLHLTV